ncbi:VWA domain-containing protein [Lacipirellula limnantheis]|uniref:von Willebrand factor type A domain protein n=1 Tax=Lacipirellula limnantheis TaxID=2528024 RepID=A0A517TTJ4_9BACT|nr:VWA domain-containing protein [Lacipirellula limnantheis]QDT71700.1 von Willebrand factor type A domain protein [Lacipirellula limnantheis]
MIELVSWRPFVWLAALVVLAIAVRYSLVDRPRGLYWASLGLRAAAILLLIIALCRPFLGDEGDDAHVLFLVDVSQSVDLKQIPAACDQIDLWKQGLRSGDSWTLFALGNGVREYESTDALRETVQKWQSGVADDAFRSATQLAEAILATRAAFSAGKSSRMVLLTDGQETDGDLADALSQVADEGIDVRRHPLAGLSDAEASVVSIEPSSREAFYGEVSRMTVTLAANAPIKGNLRLVHKGVAVQQRDVELTADKQQVVHFDVDMTTPGASVWTAELLPAEDRFVVNNQAACTVTVRGRPRVLAIHREPRELRPITRALTEQEIELEVRGEHGLPNSLEEMAAFDCIILADMPATAMTPRQMQMLKQYVVDFGGGLMMLGSENSFGLGGYYKTPVEEVLPLVSRFEKEKEKPSLAMVLVIDKSGSMDGLPIQLARQAAKSAVELLSARDSIAVIGFDDQAQVVCDMTSAADAESVQAAIDSLQAGGGTYMYPAMVEAKEMLESTPAKIRHMICLGDGHTQPADHESLAEEMADAGITVSTVALGAADKQLMATIAEIGRGRFYETDDPANVPQIFTKETMQATKSAIKEDLYASVKTSDHPSLSGYEEAELPFTLGYVMTEAKPTAQLLLAAETGDPLLAIGRYGLGTGFAYTSDLTEKWGGEWLAWDGCGKFWAQMIRSVLRHNDGDGVEIVERREGDRWLVDVRRTDPSGAPINGLAWDAALVDVQGVGSAIEMREVGLGRYEASVPLQNRQGASLRIRDTDHEKLSLLHWHRPYPNEYRLLQNPPPAMEALKTASTHSIIDELQPVMRQSPIVHYAYFGALACMIGSILFRRI